MGSVPPAWTRTTSDADPSPDCNIEPTTDDQLVVDQLVAFARSPSAEALAMLPLDEYGVRLGLGPQLLVTRSPDELEDPQAWQLGVGGGFRGYTGPFSVLELLAPAAGLTVTLGPHRHCASPPVEPPAELADLRHVSAQPTVVERCLGWFTVDRRTARLRLSAVVQVRRTRLRRCASALRSP